MSEFYAARTVLHETATYFEVFPDAAHMAIKSRYRQLMKAVHPDRVELALRDEANCLVARLSSLMSQAEAALQAGTYGAPVHDQLITSRIARHHLEGDASDFCDMSRAYRAMSDFGSKTQQSFIKLATTPRDNDLFTHEASALRTLHTQAGDEFQLFYPELIDSFVVADGRKHLRANALTYLEGFYNLEQVRELRKSGLEPLDAAWVWRRMLWALGGAHEAGVLHGAITPRHVMIHPIMHGVVLVDWCYSQQSTDNTYGSLQAIVPSCRAWYAPSVLAKVPIDQSHDLAMAARTMVYLLGGDPLSMNMPSVVPGIMQRYLIDIVTSKQPADAFTLLARFDGILKQLGTPYHPRAYRELVL